MPDVSSLSDAALMDAIGRGGGAPANPLTSMSDADLMKAIGQQQPSEAPVTAGGLLRAAGGGLAKGLAGLAGLPGDLSSLMRSVTGTPENLIPARGLPTSQGMQSGIEGITGPLHQPQNTAEQYAQTAGEFAPALVGGPESLGARLATRVAIPAAASETAGQLTQGTDLEPYARMAGAVAGAGLPRAASRVVSPASISNERAGFVNTLQKEGVNAITAGQKSGSKSLQYIESHTGDAPLAGGQATKTQELQNKQLTQAYLRRAGIDGDLASPEVLAAHDDKLSGGFNSLAAKHESIPIPGFNDAANGVVEELKSATNLDAAPALQGFINRINQSAKTQTYEWPPQAKNMVSQLKSQGVSDEQIAGTLGIKPTVGALAPKGSISGEAYQTIQSQMARAARSATDPNLKSSLYKLREALNDSVQDGLKQSGNAADADQWLALRNQYRKFLVVERAASPGTEAAAKGYLTQPQMAMAEKAIYGKRQFTQDKSPFADLTHAAGAVLKPLPQSGTAPRQLAHLIPAIIGAGAVEGPKAALIAGAAATAPGMLGRAVHSGLGQKFLSNQAAAGLRQGKLGRALLQSGILGGISAQNQ